MSVKSSLKRILREKAREVKEQAAKDTLAEMQMAAPKETGELAASLRIKNVNKHTVLVGSDLLQMTYSNYGNGTSIIRPKKNKYMWFESKKDYNLPMKRGKYYAEEVRPYKGTHWIEIVADTIRAKYGG